VGDGRKTKFWHDV
jgi:hypothetical protein